MKLAEHFSVQSISSVYDFCGPLRDRFDLTAFCYDMSFPGAELSILSDCIELFEPYYSRELTPICSNASGRTVDSGVYTAKMLYKKHVGHENLGCFKTLCKSEFGLHIINRINGYDEVATFAFSMYEDEFEHFVLNNLEKLKNFVRCFRRTMHPRIMVVQQKENRLHFPDLLAINGLDIADGNQAKKVQEKNLIIDRDDGVEMMLPPQQSTCLKLLIEGKSIKEVASQMMLSPRTVENYFFVIREKLQCHSLTALVGRYGDQLR